MSENRDWNMDYNSVHKIEFFSFRTPLRVSFLRHTGVVVYVTRKGGKKDVYVHEVADAMPGQDYLTGQASKATVYLRKVDLEKSPEVRWQQQKPFCVASKTDFPNGLKSTLEHLFETQARAFDYHALLNNCRDHVIKFAKMLENAGFSVDNAVHNHMNGTKIGDRLGVTAVALGILAVVGPVFSALSKLLSLL